MMRAPARFGKRRSLFVRGTRARGVALVELALALSMLTTLIFGAVEFAVYMQQRVALENAAREGARAAIPPNATDADVTTAATNTLTALGISTNSVTVSTTDGSGNPISVTALPVGSTIKIGVSGQWSTLGAGYRILGLIPTSKTLSGSSVVYKGG